MKVMKVREVIKRIEADGWYPVRTTGSHRHYKHPTKPGIVTISGQLGTDVPPGTLLSIFRQAQIESEDR
jgi:predicted RNA binding protein YcfA (HicA-like mRNA interferase family)